MAHVVVMYKTPKDAAAFDKHYAEIHIPLAKKIPGAYCHSAERAAALAKRGVKFLAVSSDLAMLRAGAAAALKTLKG